MNEIKIIDNLLLCLQLEGDGGFSSFSSEEYDEMYNFLNSLRNNYQNEIKEV